MNVAKYGQRTPQALAQGGRILHHRRKRGDIIAADCITRDDWRPGECALCVFRAQRKRRFNCSDAGGPYHVRREGLEAVRAQVDNR